MADQVPVPRRHARLAHHVDRMVAFPSSGMFCDMLPYMPPAAELFDDNDDGRSIWGSSDDENPSLLNSSASDRETELTVDETAPDDEGLVIPAIPIPAIAAEGHPDDGASEVSHGDWSSVSQSVYEDELSHGRRYHGYRKGRYPLPNDRQEQQREETSHAMMMELTEGHLFYSDIGQSPTNILDVGTGIVAEQYPGATVVGTDLSAIQPRWLPVNVRMYVDDCEEPDWLHGDAYDLVHFRGMAGILKDLAGVLESAYRNGGWVEFQELIPQIECDDNSMRPNDPLRMFYDAATQGLRTFGCDPLRATKLEEALERAGYINIHRVTKKIPISTWARGRRLKTLGLFMKTVMLDSLDALAAKPLAALDISPRDRRELTRLVKQSLDDNTVHRYVNCVFCYGQKREEDGAFADLDWLWD
ncbi:hypothetical protein O9K51_04199 [Purpureocillium lavendulum]|uniref:Methyltransferase n=1 Tax=Purpureocillium lavendulum TaxID=1247861 RepID=A0AB34FUN1_9HYPO|nr:hypothetical protein O9K51_04199 [Purpureocillium lavendulum]